MTCSTMTVKKNMVGDVTAIGQTCHDSARGIGYNQIYKGGHLSRGVECPSPPPPPPPLMKP